MRYILISTPTRNNFIWGIYRISSSRTTASNCLSQLLNEWMSKCTIALSQRVPRLRKNTVLIFLLYYAVLFYFSTLWSYLFDMFFNHHAAVTFNSFTKICSANYLDTLNFSVKLYNVNLLHSTLIFWALINVSHKLFWRSFIT